MPSLNDLIKHRESMADSRMAEMSAVKETDERMKLMSDMMQRKETDANNRMVDLMTTMKDLTLGVRAMASQTAAAKARAASWGAYSTPPEQYSFYQCSSTTYTSHLSESGATQRRTN